MAEFYSNNPLDWTATDGVYIAEVNTPAAPRLAGANVTQVVGAFPWGAPGVIHRIGSAEDLEKKLFGKVANPYAYTGARYLSGKVFGQMEIVRVEAADAAAAARTVNADGYKITARNKGAAANEITAQHTSNGASFDVTITWGGYTKTYAARTLANVAEINDPYVIFAPIGDADTIEASDVAPVALTGGSDGTIADGDYTDAIEVLENGTGGAGSITISDRASATILTALRAHSVLMRNMNIADAPDLADLDAALALAGAYSDDRSIFCLHGVRQLIGGVEYTVPLSSFIASILSQIPMHYSIADAEYARALLARVIGPAEGVALNREKWIAADLAGGVMLEALPGGGFKPHAGLTTYTGDADKALIFRRRVLDLAVSTVARTMQIIQNKPGMPRYDRLALNQGKRACALMRGDADKNPLTAYVADMDLTISTSTPGTRTVRLAIDFWDEIRYIVILVTSAQGLDVQETLAT